ncbi:MAG: DUF362 domain-containing protein [bacterium]|nr:DUF362 domain-containing protein [bacterium]
MRAQLNRRQLLGLGAAAVASGVARAAPTAPVAVARCRSYGPQLVTVLEGMLDQLGGIGRIVKNKTVAVKLNLTGRADARQGHLPLGVSHWTHPDVIGAMLHLMDKAGARRIRLVESPWSTAAPLGEVMLEAGWEPQYLLSAARKVEFENTNYLGGDKRYHRLTVPGGGRIFDVYDVNHSYVDCDVYVTLAKLKESPSCGVTLSIKNSFGILPATIYGEGAGKSEPSVRPVGGRTMLHTGYRLPPGFMEKDPTSPREAGYRVPRIIADLAAARPIDLAIVEGIHSITKGPGPWSRGDPKHVKPNLLIAGTNCVTSDSVCTALMGFDPMADRGTPPFENRDSTLRLAEEIGLGTRHLNRIEVLGTPVQSAVFDFRKAHRS